MSLRPGLDRTCVRARALLPMIPALMALAAAPSAPPAPPAAAAEVLRRFAGAWDATMQVVGPPGEPPQVINGIEVNTTGGQGRWVTGQFKSQIDGQPFEGHLLLAWDAASGKFRRLWADSTSSSFWISEGNWDPKTATLTMWIETRNSHGDPVRWREETTFTEETRTFTMFVPGPTTVEAAAITITYRRRPAAQKIPPGSGPVMEPAGQELTVFKDSVGVWSLRADDAGWGEEIKGTETNRWCCDGHFLVSDAVGTIGKRPYEAHAVIAWDPAQRRYQRALVDTIGTPLAPEPGVLHPDRGSVIFHVDRPDGHGGQVHATEELTSRSNGERTAVQSEEVSGKPGKALRTTRYKKER